MSKKYRFKDFFTAGVISSTVGGILVGLIVLFATNLGLGFRGCTPDIWCEIHDVFVTRALSPWYDLGYYLIASLSYYFIGLFLTTPLFLGLFALFAMPIGVLFGGLYGWVFRNSLITKTTAHIWGICGVIIGFLITFSYSMWINSWDFRRFFNPSNPDFFGLSHYGFIMLLIMIGSILSGYIAGYLGGRRLQNPSAIKKEIRVNLF